MKCKISVLIICLNLMAVGMAAQSFLFQSLSVKPGIINENIYSSKKYENTFAKHGDKLNLLSNVASPYGPSNFVPNENSDLQSSISYFPEGQEIKKDSSKNKQQKYLNQLGWIFRGDVLKRFNSFLQPGLPGLDDEKCINRITDPTNLYIQYPLISFIQPLQAGETRGAEVTYQISASNYIIRGIATALKGIKKVLVNGEEGDVKPLSDQQFSWQKEVLLKEGMNDFVVDVFTNENKENCEKIILNYDAKDSTTKEGHNYSFFIGIDDYENFPKLPTPKKDADDVERLLQEYFKFEKICSTELYDKDATKDNIDSVFRELISKLTTADNLLVYFAGHGSLDKQVNEGYWIPVEARKQKAKDYISNSEITKYLAAINAKHVVIFADACFAGSFFKTSRGDGNYSEKVEKLKSRWIFCSGREEEVEDRMNGKENSPFAYYLMEFLKKVPSDGLTASELAVELNTAVGNNAVQTPEAGPVKETGDEGGEFVFRKKNTGP